MRLIDRAVFREVALASLIGIALFTFVFFLQRLGGDRGVFSLLVRSTAPPETVIRLLALAIPATLPFTVPAGVLVGILLALSRMSGDNEITALRAAGVPARVVVKPVLVFSALAALLTGAASLWLTPWSIRETLRVSNSLVASQLTAEIQPRVFEESFPNTILYVGDVIAGPVTRWRKIFIADLRPASERSTGAREAGEAPPITIAQEAIALPDPARNRIQLSMRNGYTHETGKKPDEDFSSAFPSGEQILEAQKPAEVRASRYVEQDTVPLYRLTGTLADRDSIDAKMELHQRFALPMGCLVLALAGIPLGVSSRKAGRSSAFVLTLALVLIYYSGQIPLIGLARQGEFPIVLARWLPNALFAVAGVFFLSRLERPGDFDPVAAVRKWAENLFQRVRTLPDRPSAGRARLFFVVPQVVDTYILNSFLFYFALLLASFVSMVEVFTFFELLPEIVQNKIPLTRVFLYLFHLAPKLIYDSAPIAVLVAVLVTFGVLTKNNEVTAFKACGVSLYRLAAPVILAAAAFSGMLFAFDHYYIPDANKKQDAIRNEIKGRAVQTYLRPDRRWVFGQGSRIYYYKYFDPSDPIMVGVSVYELDPESFHLRQLITAERARWEPTLNTWVFQNGQVRKLDGIKVTEYRDFANQTATFPELTEPPGYFRREVKLSQQMNFIELDRYIGELSQSGLDTVKLQVQRQSKFAVPLFGVIMALLSIPFAFLTGSRGAMAGVGVSLGIAIAYWSVSKLFEQIGYLNQLPPALAAWAPDGIFALAGLYLMARMRT
ncbi:MAG: LptF/LptG family permease [Bryobacteraceae bacterium]|nr:LptF/LptG family permease [Bryobacteraceae bacterium]